MFAFLEGILVEGGAEAVVSVGGGVGLDVQLSAQSAARLPAPGEAVRLWTHLAVREDSWSLFGFCDLEERAMFRLLITVSGIGPKVALGMLSGAEPAEIARCLRTGDEKTLARLPGIGKKSAARLVVELGQRVPAILSGADGTVTAGPPAGSLGEALEILQAMGLPAAQAEALLQQARQANPAVADDVQIWIRSALGGMGAPGR
jgi:Holliday junction DNA helicase RuvA